MRRAAGRVVRRRAGIVDRDALLDLVRRAAPDDPDPVATTDALLDHLGLLVERGHLHAGLFGFLHLSIEEHLAGRHLVGQGAAAVASVLGDDRWVEPLRLGLGHLSRADPSALRSLLRDLLAGARAGA